MNLKIFCYGCKEEINALDRCPKCETRGILDLKEP
jgi:hypothetical protein